MTVMQVGAGEKPRRSFQEVWVISFGHALTHWYPATFYLLLPLIGNELGLSYGQIGSILTCQFAAGAIANVPGEFSSMRSAARACSWPCRCSGSAFLICDGVFSRLLDDARLRDDGRHRQQSLASHRDPLAGDAFSRAQGAGDVLSQHGRQRRRRVCAIGGRCAARRLELA